MAIPAFAPVDIPLLELLVESDEEVPAVAEAPATVPSATLFGAKVVLGVALRTVPELVIEAAVFAAVDATMISVGAVLYSIEAEEAASAWEATATLAVATAGALAEPSVKVV
jgi:hypothetical protein